MKLHKITLKNIRSYVNQEITFPEGSTLLWGDIGSGKSSILIAIDFALFGLQRSALSGSSLLRNGADEGFVELTFSIEDMHVVIHRRLKRSRGSVLQESGHIIRNGLLVEKSAIELKEAVLSLLHYPKELLTKNKSLIYRYTVYTPQEEMKHILLGSKEDRLDILRKVFGVDKYKRVKTNAKLVASKLRELKKLYEGASADFQEKILEKERILMEKEMLAKQVEEAKPKIALYSMEVEKKKKELQLLEEKQQYIEMLKKDIALAQTELKHKIEKRIVDKERIEKLSLELRILRTENLIVDDSLDVTLQEKESYRKEKEKELRYILNKIQELKTKTQHSEHLRQSVEKLSNCPTCFQEVSSLHKNNIISKSQEDVQSLAQEMVSQQQMQTQQEQLLTQLKREVELLQKRAGEMALIKHKVLLRNTKEKELETTQEMMQALKVEIGALNTKVMTKEAELLQLKAIEEVYPSLKKEYLLAEEHLQRLQLEQQKVEGKLEPITRQLVKLEEELEKKKKLKEKKESIAARLFWLQESFTPSIESMEKNVLFKVHESFTSLFEKWFKILVDTDMLEMTLDEEYSPKILQNGYDIDYAHLSGGEKTAGALAYRLALNQVINTMNAGIKTQDLLILDEPTDGFSQEQLERLKLLMDEIDIPQIIIVSHESQIESFVDNIIKLEKVGHETQLG